ncbi:MAG: hypothetical protein COB08_000750 [Rhodobacteraceae bacterium]|nr:hypothetical protein [Paracoccaceae bacterium]
MTKNEYDDFSDPKKLKVFFEELDTDFSDLNRDRLAENIALQAALMAVLTALDDQLPAVRDIVVHTLDEAIEKTKGPFAGGPPEMIEAEQTALEELRAKVFFANKLIVDE